MTLYWVLLLGQTLLGLYGDAGLCERAKKDVPQAVCVQRDLP